MNNNNTNDLKISPNFTIDDIHKIREWDYQNFKNSSTKEWISYINKSAKETRKNSGLKFEINDGIYIHRKF
jgi:hypothetical protein